MDQYRREIIRNEQLQCCNGGSISSSLCRSFKIEPVLGSVTDGFDGAVHTIDPVDVSK